MTQHFAPDDPELPKPLNDFLNWAHQWLEERGYDPVLTEEEFAIWKAEADRRGLGIDSSGCMWIKATVQ